VLYASLADITAVFGPLTPAQQTAATQLLRFAGALVRQQVPRLEDRLNDDTLDPDALAAVVTAMVVRVLQNPDGRRQGSRSIDDFSESWTIDAALSTGALYLSDVERSSLLAVGTARTVRSVRTVAHGERWPVWSAQIRP
jgi:hypothetical protein